MEVFGEVLGGLEFVVGNEGAVLKVVLVLLGEGVGVFEIGDGSVEVDGGNHVL